MGALQATLVFIIGFMIIGRIGFLEKRLKLYPTIEGLIITLFGDKKRIQLYILLIIVTIFITFF
jgi:hypothetical protein